MGTRTFFYFKFAEGPLTITKEPIMPAVIGQLTEIGFRSSLDTGLKYCLFIRPDGTYINVGSQPQNPYGKSPYTYTGQGLESGKNLKIANFSIVSLI